MTTSSLKAPDLAQAFISPLIEEVKAAPGRAYRMIWDAFFPVLVEHWLLTIGLLVLLLVVAFLRWLITGRWAMLGSVLYTYIYWGTMFLIGLCFGPEIYANDYFQIVSLLLWPISFITVGLLLAKSGISGTRRF